MIIFINFMIIVIIIIIISMNIIFISLHFMFSCMKPWTEARNNNKYI